MTLPSYNTLEPTEPQFTSKYSDDSERESLLYVETKTASDEPVRGYRNRSIIAFLVFAIIGVTVLVSANTSSKVDVKNVSDMQTHLIEPVNDSVAGMKPPTLVPTKYHKEVTEEEEELEVVEEPKNSDVKFGDCEPSKAPTTKKPTKCPIIKTIKTKKPTKCPTVKTPKPTKCPTVKKTSRPTKKDDCITDPPTYTPTKKDDCYTDPPTYTPTKKDDCYTYQPTYHPTKKDDCYTLPPTYTPSYEPTCPKPSYKPSCLNRPSRIPTCSVYTPAPTPAPTGIPTCGAPSGGPYSVPVTSYPNMTPPISAPSDKSRYPMASKAPSMKRPGSKRPTVNTPIARPVDKTSLNAVPTDAMTPVEKSPHRLKSSKRTTKKDNSK